MVTVQYLFGSSKKSMEHASFGAEETIARKNGRPDNYRQDFPPARTSPNLAKPKIHVRVFKAIDNLFRAIIQRLIDCKGANLAVRIFKNSS